MSAPKTSFGDQLRPRRLQYNIILLIIVAHSRN